MEVKHLQLQSYTNRFNKKEIGKQKNYVYIHFVCFELIHQHDAILSSHWAWTQFTKVILLPNEIKEKLKNGENVKLDIVSKAMDSSFNLQPETSEPYWNARGVCVNHWYHVKTTLDPKSEKDSFSHAPDVVDEFGNTPSGGKFASTWGDHGWKIDPKHQTDSREYKAPEAKHF